MYQNCKFHISHYSEYVFSSSLSIYFKLIAIVLQDYDAAFLYNCWFLFIILMGLLICKYALFWQEFSVKSLILRWPLRPVGLLFDSKLCFITALHASSLQITQCCYSCTLDTLGDAPGSSWILVILGVKYHIISPRAHRWSYTLFYKQKCTFIDTRALNEAKMFAYYKTWPGLVWPHWPGLASKLAPKKFWPGFKNLACPQIWALE